MARTNKQGFWIDSTGNPVPEKYVDVDDRKKDRLVEQLFKKIEREQQRLIDLKKEIFTRVDRLLDETAGKYDEEEWKGNATITNFSNTKKIERKVNDRIVFNEKLQLAKQKIDKFFKELTKDSKPELQTLVNDAFDVDKKGNINKRRILRLRHININNPTWNEAMELIDEAIQVESTKEYIVFYRKPNDDQNKDYNFVTLNFSALEVE